MTKVQLFLIRESIKTLTENLAALQQQVQTFEAIDAYEDRMKVLLDHIQQPSTNLENAQEIMSALMENLHAKVKDINSPKKTSRPRKYTTIPSPTYPKY